MYIRLRSKSIDVLPLEMYNAYLQVISNNEQKKKLHTKHVNKLLRLKQRSKNAQSPSSTDQ